MCWYFFVFSIELLYWILCMLAFIFFFFLLIAFSNILILGLMWFSLLQSRSVLTYLAFATCVPFIYFSLIFQESLPYREVLSATLWQVNCVSCIAFPFFSWSTHEISIWRCMHRASPYNMYINQQDAQILVIRLYFPLDALHVSDYISPSSGATL